MRIMLLFSDHRSPMEMIVEPREDLDQELLALADATDRVADDVTDPAINRRLREIAIEVRQLAAHGAGQQAASV